MARVITAPLKPGFIFIQDCECECGCTPTGYEALFMGGFGTLYKLDPKHGNGCEPVTVEEYHSFT